MNTAAQALTLTAAARLRPTPEMCRNESPCMLRIRPRPRAAASGEGHLEYVAVNAQLTTKSHWPDAPLDWYVAFVERGFIAYISVFGRTALPQHCTPSLDLLFRNYTKTVPAIQVWRGGHCSCWRWLGGSGAHFAGTSAVRHAYLAISTIGHMCYKHASISGDIAVWPIFAIWIWLGSAWGRWPHL